VRRAFIREGASLKKAARVVSDAMDAQYVEVAKHEGAIMDERSYVDHQTRLKAATTVCEIFAPRVAGRDGEPRLMLNVEAGGQVQLLYFGNVIGEVPEAQGATATVSPEPMSATAKQHLIRTGQLLPDGTAQPTAKAIDEAKALPESTPKGEGFLK
jgi:hypothetical protein